jgi:hypothetical protein
MDIKKLLNQELQAAERAKEEKEKEDAALDKEAANLFQPIVAGIEQLKSELSGHSDIQLNISTHSITVRLGNDRELDTHLYGWSRGFSVEETARFNWPEYEEIKQTHKFNDAPSVVSFIIKKCAEYIANKKG